jgi:transcriptional regulator with PAS, ATPase and Fis domain
MLPSLSDYLADFSKVIIMKYNMPKVNLEPLKDIPAGQDVLVINDSNETTLQTIYMLYESGYNHISLYPYIEDSVPSKSYDSFEFCAATNDSLHLVPSTCRKIVNLQNRDISFETFQKLMHVLELDSHDIHRKILSQIETDSLTKFNFVDDFLSSELKAQLLTDIMENFSFGLILIDKGGKVHYVNEKGYDIFGVYTNENIATSPNYDKTLFEGLDFKNKLVTIGKFNYMAEKKTISAFNYTLGICLMLQDEQTLRGRETSFSQQLKNKGFYAKHTFDDIVYQSSHMERCIRLAKQAAPSDYTILIRGESGTGKELLAQSIHNYSLRSNAPFVAINCAALPESLLESELFGYTAGAFTGAQKHGKTGLFEQAQR